MYDYKIKEERILTIYCLFRSNNDTSVKKRGSQKVESNLDQGTFCSDHRSCIFKLLDLKYGIHFLLCLGNYYAYSVIEWSENSNLWHNNPNLRYKYWAPGRFEPTTSWTWAKHSTTELFQLVENMALFSPYSTIEGKTLSSTATIWIT